MNLKALATAAASKLRSQANALEVIEELDTRAWSFNTSSLSDRNRFSNLLHEIRQWGADGEPRIYRFSCQPGADLKGLRRAFSDAKASEKDQRAYARLNSPESLTLYVGGSSSLSKRIGEHLGFGARRTYAMHLACWAQPFSLEVEICAARYSHSADIDVMQALEDSLWREMNPMFGRLGRR